MAFVLSALRSTSIGTARSSGQRSQREWRYVTGDTVDQVLQPGYFAAAPFGVGDTVAIIAGLAAAPVQLVCVVTSAKPVTLSWQAANSYNRSSMVLLGDSRLAYAYRNNSNNLRRTGTNFIPIALKLSGQRMKVEKSFAVGGQRTDQYLAEANVMAALACNSYWLVVYGIVNDVALLGGAADYWNANMRPVVERWTATGRGVILLTETGNNVLDAAGKAAVIKYNAQIRAYARNNRNVILFDVAAIVMQPGAEMTFNPAFTLEGTHVNTVAGAIAVGTKFAELIKQIVPPCDGLVYSVGQVFANGGAQLFANPLFITTDSNPLSGIMTGTKPTGFNRVTAPAGTSIVSSVVAGAYGNDWQMQITAGAAGVVSVISDFTNIEVVGERYYENCEFDVVAGHSNFQSAATYIESSRGGIITIVEDGSADTNSGNLPAGAYSFTSETEYLTIGSGAYNWLSARLLFYFSAAGSATVKVRRFGLNRVMG